MKLEVGKSYMTKSGIQVTIVEKDVDNMYPFKGNYNGSEYDFWTRTGSLRHNRVSQMDLVKTVDTDMDQTEFNKTVVSLLDKIVYKLDVLNDFNYSSDIIEMKKVVYELKEKLQQERED